MSGVSRVIDEHGTPQTNCFQIGDQGDATNVPLAELQALRSHVAVAPTPVAVSVKRASEKASSVLSARQLISQLKARLREVEREIKVRKTLEDERDQLRRLMSAAKAERNNVRRIRSAV